MRRVSAAGGVPRPPSRAFAAALMLASTLGGACVALLGASIAVRAAAAVLASGTLFLGCRLFRGRAPRRPHLLFLLAMILAAEFFAFLAASSPPFPLRLLQVAAVLCYGATLLAAALRILRIAGSGPSLLLSFSLALALFASEIVVPGLMPRLVRTRRLESAAVPRWVGDALPHPVLGHCNPPRSTARSYYPDNPRGYFERSDPVRDVWTVVTHEGSEARLEHSADQPGSMRLTVVKAAGGVLWHVQLCEGPIRLVAGEEYLLTFRARSDRAARVACAVYQGHAPWQPLGLYTEFEVRPDWQLVERVFVASKTDRKARVRFDVANCSAPLDLSGIELRRAATATQVLPDVPPSFFVQYRYNALGFRGRDYATPRPPGVFRILALGDSFTLGVGVHERDTFTVQLEQLLNNRSSAGRPATTYEVINGGVSGYGTREERLSYELFSSRYESQVVLLVMVFNDDRSWLDDVRLGYFLLPNKYHELSNLWLLLQSARHRRPKADFSGSIRELLALNESCRQRRAKLAVVIFRNLSYYERWTQLLAAVEAGLEGTGIPFLDLGDALLSGRSEKDLIVHEADGHPNELAHRIAAEEILRFLTTEGLLRE